MNSTVGPIVSPKIGSSVTASITLSSMGLQSIKVKKGGMPQEARTGLIDFHSRKLLKNEWFTCLTANPDCRT